MLQGPTFEVAIGMILLFLTTSLLASAVVEVVGGFFHRRSKNLWDTIDLLLGSAEVGDGEDVHKLVDRIYRQPYITKLVQPKAQSLYPKDVSGGRTSPGLRSYKSTLGTSERKRRFHGPQDITPVAFTNAFIETVRPGGNAEASVAQLKAEVGKLPDAISKPIEVLLTDVGNDFVTARKRIEDWYETHMKAVSTWYRKQTRYFLFAAGLVIAVGGNVDAIGAARTLYRDPSVRQSVLAQAETIDQTQCKTVPGAGAQVDCLRDELGGAVRIPVGWADLDRAAGAWMLRALGWILVAGAVTMGAPFWFDLLRRGLGARKRDGG